MANTAVSFSRLDTILNNNEFNSMCFSASTWIFFIADLLLGNVFWAKYKYMSLKKELTRYPAYISFIITGKCVPFSTSHWIIFNILSISVCFGKHFCTVYSLFTKLFNSFSSWKYDLSGLWYASDIIPSWYWEIFLNSMSILGLVSALLSNFCGHKFSGGLGGGL